MRMNYFFSCFFITLLFTSNPTFSQTVNFDETWAEFLKNNKISNMSELTKPDKVRAQKEYAKYLLMNTNSSFCQSDIEDAEKLMEEIKELGSEVHQSIPEYAGKMLDLETKIEAYYSIDAIWTHFLLTKEVMWDELQDIKAAKTSCEKRTLAKYSYLTAYYHFCNGNVAKAKDIFENRTLRLTEKTTLRVDDVEGLKSEVATMKTLFQDMAKLDIAWDKYVKTDVSPGFDIELPLFPCYPIPKMKEYVLKGVLDICNSAPPMLAKIKDLQVKSGVAPSGDLKRKVQELEAAVGQNENNLAVLNDTWKAFIPDNKVKQMNYGYEYCAIEPLIRAYILDGFAYNCNEEVLEKIDSILESDNPPLLEDITLIKINDLRELNELYRANGRNIEKVWDNFVAQGDVLTQDYESTDLYCDYIHHVKDWTIRGLSGNCEEGNQYLERIEDFNETFEFKFYEELECRVQRLRIKVWDCRHEALQELARIEASEGEYEKRLEELMTEYKMGERPELCPMEK